MHLPLQAIITVPDTQEMAESLATMSTGFIVVMSVLCFLWLSISITGKFFVLAHKRALQNNAQTDTAPTNEEISPVTLALISAAVQTTLNSSCRIIEIKPRSSSESGVIQK